MSACENAAGDLYCNILKQEWQMLYFCLLFGGIETDIPSMSLYSQSDRILG